MPIDETIKRLEKEGFKFLCRSYGGSFEIYGKGDLRVAYNTEEKKIIRRYELGETDKEDKNE